MTQAKLMEYLRSLECQKRDPGLLEADGPYCLRKLREHLEDVRDMLRKIKGTGLIGGTEDELLKEEAVVKEAVAFYSSNGLS
jgi:hypothetical protein